PQHDFGCAVHHLSIGFECERRPAMMRCVHLFIACVASFALGCGSGPDDETLTIKVQSKLNAAPQTSTVEAQAKHEVVTLMGSVGSEATRTKAEQIVRQVAGVKQVRNQIVVQAGGPPR